MATLLKTERGPAGRALILHPVLHGGGDGGDGARGPGAALKEAASLAEAIGLTVVHAETVRLDRPVAATLLGSGTVRRIGELLSAAAGRGEPVDVVLVDHALSPAQQRNLERAWNAKVIDRTALILEIFGERARTREGRLQVELASLSYQRSRLVRSWTHLGRQRGGYGFLGGPGESQLETDRRLIADRIARLKHELGGVRRTRGLHRSARRRAADPVVALVGYTNAGKSTLFNRLSGAAVQAEDRLFATLDPTMRGVRLPAGRRVILSDTVGFISGLPHGLVEAFRATLEEVQAADLILHVRDVSHPETEAQRADVEATLRELGIDPAADQRLVEVANKIDLLDEGMRAEVLGRALRDERFVALSARTGEGTDELLSRLDRLLRGGREVVELDVDLADGEALAMVHAGTEVLSREDRDGHARLRVAADPDMLSRLLDRGAVGLVGDVPLPVRLGRRRGGGAGAGGRR